MGPYVRALEAVVKPGAVVVDVGSGTGVLALVACRLGAGRVYAIETNDLIEVGRELARENGVADRIVFIQKDAREAELPERADVIVSDLRGTLPLFGDHLGIIADVRARFLKPGGRMVPAGDRLMVAVAEQPELFEWAVGRARGPLGVTLESMRSRLQHAPCPDRESAPLRPEHLISTAATWAVLDYATVRAEPVAGRAELRVERSGKGHGLILWFESTLEGKNGFTTAPGHELCYGRYFLPWPVEVALSPGVMVTVDLWAQPGGSPWGWNSAITATGATRAAFKQSSFLASPSRPSNGLSMAMAPPSQSAQS